MREKLVAGLACAVLSLLMTGCPLFEGPEAAFTATPTEGNVPLTVLFVDQSTAGSTDLTDWQWDFGDGRGSTARNPSHVYTAPGTYRVTLTVTSRLGNDTETKVDFITVRELPRADFTASPRTGEGPLQVTFSDISTAGAAPITDYAWDFGDGNTSDAANPVHTYEDPGTYTVELTVTTAIGENTRTRANFITVQQRPEASFTASPTSGAAPLAVQFTDTSDRGSAPLTNWHWDFGDGSTSTRQNPSHVYTTAGSFTVSLTVASDVGESPTVTQRNFIVVVELPRADFSASPTTGPAPLNVNFSDRSSGGSSEIVEWLWDFGDSTSSTLPSPSHRYASDGVFDVSLTVTTSAGNTHTVTKPSFITAQRRPDAAFAATPRNGEAPLTVQFTDLSDPGSAPITSWQWDFGDGSTSNDRNPFHAYSSPGRYTVTLGVSTAVGDDTVTQVNFIQVEQQPTAAFSATPTSGAAPLTVRFADQSTPGSSEITAWSWDFGDGTSSTQRNPEKTYNEAGIFTVSLTVTSGAGSDTVTKANHITVSRLPSADFSANVTTGKAPLTVLFSDQSTAGSESLNGWTWDFGDGTTSNRQSPSHVYSAPGIYTVSLTATSSVGSDTETKSGFLTVRPAVNFSASPTSGVGSLSVDFTDTTVLDSLDVESRTWNFGDGGTSSEESPTHNYAEPGVYDVTLTLQTSLDGQADSRTRSGFITVRPEPAFTADATSGDGSLTVNFTNTTELGSLELDGVLWKFGDGNTSQVENPSHTYAVPGTYSVELAITTAAGTQSTTMTDLITVRPVPDFTADVTAGTAPLKVAFENTTELGNLAITGRLWTFGDGATSEFQDPSKTYSAPGNYDVTLRLTTEQGVVEVTKEAFIQVAPTVAFTTDVDSGMAPLDVEFTSTTDAGSLTVTAWSWDFGDGSGPGSGMVVNHTYSDPGTYDVSLTVTTEQGDTTAVVTEAITVSAKSLAAAPLESGGLDRAYALLERTGGGFAVAGALDTDKDDGVDAFLTLTDVQGEAETGWPRTYGGPGTQQARDMVATSDGGYLLAGTNHPDGGESGVYLLKLDDAGDVVWERTPGGAGAYGANAAVELRGGGYAIAGWHTPEGGKANRDGYVARLDEQGQIVHEATFNGARDDEFFGLVESADGELVLAGESTSYSDGEPRTWVVKLDADLNERASVTVDDAGAGGARGIVAAADGGFVIGGTAIPPHADAPSIVLLKLDGSLTEVVWQHRYGGPGINTGLALAPTAAGGYLITGNTDRGTDTGIDVAFIRTDSEGNVLEDSALGGDGDESGLAVVETADGGAGIAGVSNGGDGESALFIRLDPAGTEP